VHLPEKISARKDPRHRPSGGIPWEKIENGGFQTWDTPLAGWFRMENPII
jgi:hypothetical protein